MFSTQVGSAGFARLLAVGAALNLLGQVLLIWLPYDETWVLVTGAIVGGFGSVIVLTCVVLLARHGIRSQR